MIETVIFDWSGVLSDDWEATFVVSNEVLKHWGHERLSREKFKELYELPWMNFYKKLRVTVDEEKEYKLWEKIFPNHMHLIKPFSDAKEVLSKLKSSGKKVVVFSAHNQNLLEREIEDYGFSDLIDSVDASNSDKRAKVEQLVLANEIEKEDCIYVGDMCHDVETARLAGIKSVAVLSGYDSREKLECEKPNYIIEGVGELPALIEEIEVEENARVAANN